LKILAIETSTARGSVALWEGDAVVLEEVFHAPRGHNTAIFGSLEKILDRSGSEFDVIAVGTGPGSYGGIRVGIAVANALSLTFESAVGGLPSLLAPTETISEDYTVVGDARRGTFFTARVRGARLAGGVDLRESAAFSEAIAAMSRDGERIITFDEKPLDGVGEGAVAVDYPSAGRLARRLAGMSKEEIRISGERPLEPIYLRAPYITTPKKR